MDNNAALNDFLAEFIKYLPNPNEDSSPYSASCSLDFLISPDDNLINVFEHGAEIKRKNVEKVPFEETMPNILKDLCIHKSSSNHNPFKRTQYSYKHVFPPKAITNESNDYDIEITVRFYRPPRASYRGFKVESPVFAEEFLCLGSNLLSELRDKISCVCKGKRFVDISNEPEAPLPILDTNPGYFFIHDTFYNDTRNPNNCDYSETVTKWARTALRTQDANFKVARMETTRLIDLTVSLGMPLHYLHHGNCEHLFVFSQVEVLMPQSKYPHRSLYPYLRSFNNFNRRACYLCGVRSYCFIVEYSNRQLHDPAYLCRNCFYSFHYNEGKKIRQFNAYRLYDQAEHNDDELSDHQHDNEIETFIESLDEFKN